MKRILGKIIHAIAVAHRFILSGLVHVIETGVLLAKSFIKGCLLLFSMGGCLVVFLLIGPIGAWIFSHPIILVILVLIVFFPVLGAIFVGYLNDFKEVSTRYLFGLSEYLMRPDMNQRRSYSYHRQAYRTEKAEEARRARERREWQQRMWEERFRRWQGGFGQNTAQGYGAYGASGSAPGNPYVDFKVKYEKSCDALGVPVSADPSRIKLAYRKKAKQFHPDVNKDSGATAKFQEINEAYEFLNEDNIQRYRNLRHG